MIHMLFDHEMCVFTSIGEAYSCSDILGIPD